MIIIVAVLAAAVVVAFQLDPSYLSLSQERGSEVSFGGEPTTREGTRNG